MNLGATGGHEGDPYTPDVEGVFVSDNVIVGGSLPEPAGP